MCAAITFQWQGKHNDLDCKTLLYFKFKGFLIFLSNSYTPLCAKQLRTCTCTLDCLHLHVVYTQLLCTNGILFGVLGICCLRFD